MTDWIVLLGLLALLLGLAVARRRILQEPGVHLGQGIHVLDGSDDAAPVPAPRENEPGG